MDRTWMNHKGINDRKKLSYVAGVDSFLEFAFTGREVGAKLRCPCLNCNFQLFHDRDTMKCHLIAKGIVRDYNPWVHHGETLEHVSTSDQCQHETWMDEDDDVSDDELIVGDDLSSLLNDASRAYDNVDDESLWENVEFKEANVVEVGENDDESSIPRDDVEPTLVDAKNAQQNDSLINEADEFSDDETNDEDDHEDVFSDRDSSIASLDKDLEEVEFDSDSCDENY
ncbi:Replicase polyprotein 1a [Bienertia sinuspersici]